MAHWGHQIQFREQPKWNTSTATNSHESWKWRGSRTRCTGNLMLTAFYFGLRVSEVVNILGEDVQDGQLVVKRLKNSNRTLQPIPVDEV